MATRVTDANLASGGHTVGTSWTTLITHTSPGTYEFYVDLTNLADGDRIEIEIAKIIRSGGSYRVIDIIGVDNDVTRDGLFSYALTNVDGLRIRFRQTLGTARAYDYALWAV
jgi:hypothetical protein